MNPAPCPARFAFEAHHRVEEEARLGAAHEISHEDEVCVPADPASGLVHQPARAGDRAKRAQVAVEIADRDDARRHGPHVPFRVSLLHQCASSRAVLPHCVVSQL